MTAKKGYIPRRDNEFDEFQKNLMARLKADTAKFALSTASNTELTALQTEWESRLAAHNEAQIAAETASVAKDTARTNYEAAIRRQVRQTQSAPTVTDADRADLGLTIRDTQPTAPAAPNRRPVVQVDTSQRLQHELLVTDELTPNSRSKPDGVSHYEIWVKVGGPPPTDESELRFLGIGTTAAFIAKFKGADGGQTAHYWARWVNSRKEKGPWSQTVSATITA
jgi:hypothetical protein